MHARRTSAVLLSIAALAALAACADGALTAPAGGARAAIIIGGDPPVLTTVESPTDPTPLSGGSAAVPVTATYTGGDPTGVTLDCAGGVATDVYASGGVAGGTCVYTTTGVYVPVLTLDGPAPSTMPSTTYAVVYDSGSGFVTGGGWVVVPQGSYPVDPSLTGRASFGFVSKYHKGAATPSGETEFQFQAGRLNFHGHHYQWLVVAGSKAQFKGEGTINNQGRYGFMVTAIDGRLAGTKVDRFRIRIWDLSSGATVFDNQMGSGELSDDATPLASGSISIKK